MQTPTSPSAASLRWVRGDAPASRPDDAPLAGPTQAEIAESDRAYRWTHGGRAPDKMLYAPVACAVDRTLAELGATVAVEYLADKSDGLYTYRHLFESEPPTLAADVNTSALHFVGGLYEITAHGVEDIFDLGARRHPGSAQAEFGRRIAAGARHLPGASQGDTLGPESMRGAKPMRLEAARCAGKSLAALGPLTALEWRDAGGVVRRHEFPSGSAPLLTFDRTTFLLHVVKGLYTVNQHGVTTAMHNDQSYAVISNPGPGTGSRHVGLQPHPFTRDNPGMFVTTQELPDHEPKVVIGGTLIALGLGLLGALAVEWVATRFLASMPRLALAMRLVGVVAGVGVAFHYPVIGAALGAAAALSSFHYGYAHAAQIGPNAPAAGLEDGGGLFTPYPTGAFRA